MKYVTLSLSILIVTAVVVQAKEAPKKKKPRRARPTLEQRIPDGTKPTADSEARLDKWFRDAKFGAFIHFGVYSSLEGKYKDRGETHKYAEWIQMSAKIPKKEYQEIAAQFNPSEFDAEEWVKIFKDNGMRYVVITSKHHDGFALFKSEISSFNIVDHTPFKRDIIKELSEACHRNGLKFGVYYSHSRDWESPDAPGGNKELHPDMPEGFKPDMDKYLREKSLPQVEELVKNYEIDLIWFDTPNGITFERAKPFSDVVRKYRPDCVINSRIVRGHEKATQENLQLFDYISLGDKEVPSSVRPVYVESPDSVSSSYGYKKYGNHEYHSEEEMIDRLVNTVCNGGNYLLNNGPMGNGKIDPEAVRLYGIIGKWMKDNAESIHDTRPNPFEETPEWGNVSMNKEGDILYLHIMKWPDAGKIDLSPVPVKVKKVHLLANGDKVKFAKKSDVLTVTLPEEPGDEYDTVLKVYLADPLNK